LRATPLCPYFGTCGGCQIQHLNEKGQMEYKLNAVKEAFNRIGHVALPEISIQPARLQWGYRRHVTMQLKASNKGFQAGYVEVDHRSILFVQTCPIFNALEDPLLTPIQEFLSGLSNPSEMDGKLVILKNEKNQLILSFEFDSSPSLQLHEFQAGLQKYPFIAGLSIRTPKENFQFGEVQGRFELENLTFHYHPYTFIQNHPEQSENIYKQVLNLLPPSKNILDLYCGFGMTSLLLAKQGHNVTGIEGNLESITLAKENCRLNQIKHAHFIMGDVERSLPKVKQKWDVILVNPPRTGLSKELIAKLVHLQAKEWIYISCMPSTLARDLKLICSNEYEIKFCKAYDMFPQTAHVETLVHLTKC
jgi:23S rRNA (uracil1939-C5)-methyltransferase